MPAARSSATVSARAVAKPGAPVLSVFGVRTGSAAENDYLGIQDVDHMSQAPRQSVLVSAETCFGRLIIRFLVERCQEARGELL